MTTQEIKKINYIKQWEAVDEDPQQRLLGEGGVSCIFCPRMDAKPLEDGPVLYEIVWAGGRIYGSR